MQVQIDKISEKLKGGGGGGWGVGWVWGGGGAMKRKETAGRRGRSKDLLGISLELNI